MSPVGVFAWVFPLRLSGTPKNDTDPQVLLTPDTIPSIKEIAKPNANLLPCFQHLTQRTLDFAYPRLFL